MAPKPRCKSEGELKTWPPSEPPPSFTPKKGEPQVADYNVYAQALIDQGLGLAMWIPDEPSDIESWRETIQIGKVGRLVAGQCQQSIWQNESEGELDSSLARSLMLNIGLLPTETTRSPPISTKVIKDPAGNQDVMNISATGSGFFTEG